MNNIYSNLSKDDLENAIIDDVIMDVLGDDAFDNREDGFVNLLGREPTDEEWDIFYATKQALGVETNDAVCLFLSTLRRSPHLRKQFQEALKKVKNTDLTRTPAFVGLFPVNV